MSSERPRYMVWKTEKFKRSSRIRKLSWQLASAEQLEARTLLAADFLEPNDGLDTATVLGSEPTVTLRDLTIHENVDGSSNPDFFRVTANETGKLIVNALFAHSGGNLDLSVHDEGGNVLAIADSLDDDERIVVPVVTQQVYFVQVFGVGGATNDSYALEIENFPVPVPSGVFLDPLSDTGSSDNDGVTSDLTPRMVIQADLSDFRAMGVDVLTADQAAAGDTPGAAVFVTVSRQDFGGKIEGFAEPIGGTSDLFAFRPTIETIPVDGAYLVSAAVQIFDGSDPIPATGRSQLSVPYELQIDTVRPELTSPQLIPPSDTGMSAQDGVTRETQPAFVGISEPNARVRVRANGLIVGEGVAGSDARWEVTVEPLKDGIYAFTADSEDLAGNFSENSNVVLVEVDTLAPNTPYLDLLPASDTGVSQSDDVTGTNELTFNMTTTDPNSFDHLDPFNYKYRIFVRPDGGQEQLLYDSVTDDTIPPENKSGGFTDLESLIRTMPALPDGVHNFKLEVEDRAGNISEDYLLTVTIDSAPPALLDFNMLSLSDSGMSNEDRVTNIQQPAFAGVGEVGARVNIYANGALVGAGVVGSDASDGVLGDGLGAWEVTVEPLVDGNYEFVAQLEDMAGNFVQSDTLVGEIDTLAPNTPYLDLITASDTGEPNDEITTDDTPTFTFTTQDPNQARHLDPFNYKYRLFLRPEGGTEVLIYDSVVDPTLQLQDGLTELEFLERTFGPFPEGIHNFKLEVEDRAGNISPDAILNVEIRATTPGGDESNGPRIENVTRDDEGFTSLFRLKPTADGPDPLINRIVVHFSDALSANAGGSQDAVLLTTALEEGNYRLVGDANGNIPIVDVAVLDQSADANVTRTAIVLTFGVSLPDDRFTFTVFDRIRDPAGNPLDGESDAVAPFVGNPGLLPTPPNFPTGDGLSGGDFQARFTVDSRPEIGVWAAGSEWVDTNGNFYFDAANTDYVNRDIVYSIGFTSDDIFSGNFAADGQVADGFDKLAAYGRVQGTFRWLIDVDNDGVPDIDSPDPANVNGAPVAGHFDANAANGEEVGVYNGRTWFFDTDHDYQVDRSLNSDLRGYPIVGDFDGDGFDDLGAWSDDEFQFDLANGTLGGWDGQIDVSFRFGFIGVRERPVAADMNQDGFDDVGLWTPDRAGVTPRAAGEWYFLVSEGASIFDRITPAFDPIRGQPVVSFTPIPFGPDIFAQFGDMYAEPLVGNFDPPVLPKAIEVADEPSFTNPEEPLDVSGDGEITPRDALLIINYLNDEGSTSVDELPEDAAFLDVDGDGEISPRDVLLVINALNDRVDPVVTEPALDSLDEPAAETDDAINLIAADIAGALDDDPLRKPSV